LVSLFFLYVFIFGSNGNVSFFGSQKR